MDGFLVGLWIGVSVSLLIVLVVIIQVNKLSLENDSAFSRDFPTWRGVAIFIFYLWILGFNTYMYERYKITHRLIFKFNDHHYSKAIHIFKIAGFHTSAFLILFLLYVLDLAGVYRVQGFGVQYYAMLSWATYMLFLFVPLPVFNYKGRLFALKLLVQSLLSPCRGVTFPISWLTNQASSLVTPLKDFSYTVCYYT